MMRGTTVALLVLCAAGLTARLLAAPTPKRNPVMFWECNGCFCDHSCMIGVTYSDLTSATNDQARFDRSLRVHLSLHAD